jgi:LacI family transcriptional regulator
VSDNAGGAGAAVRHLIAAGHRRIAFLGDLRDIATATERFAGYADALSKAGIAVDEELVKFDLHSVEAAQAATGSLVRERAPTALFATQNLITIGALRALHARQLHQSVALVGFDDFLLADMLEPGVTVVAQDPAAIGAAACEILFERMDGDTAPTRAQTIPTRLIVRGSGEIAP